MVKQIIEFKVHGDNLERETPFTSFAANTINYIEARFYNLDDRAWTGYDNIYAVWYTDFKQIETEIVDGAAIIPAELLTRPGILKMNLCADKTENGVLVARNTSRPVDVLELTRANI